jgi:hypothetical protein
MKQHYLVGVFAATLSLSACQNMGNLQSVVDLGAQIAMASVYGNQTSMVGGLKEMLTLSSDRASTYLSSANVWNMLLPDSAKNVVTTLRAVGLGGYVDKVQGTMNQGAALAVQEAKPTFAAAVRDMTVVDALSIWKGGDTAATQYFRGKTEAALRAKFQPIVQSSLKQTGYYNQYQTLINAYNAIPLTSKPNLDLETYVLDKTLDGMFAKMANEETLIRKNPAQRGTVAIQGILGAIK